MLISIPLHSAARWEVSLKPEMCYVHSSTVHRRILPKEHNIININKCVHTAQFNILCTDCTKTIYCTSYTRTVCANIIVL